MASPSSDKGRKLYIGGLLKSVEKNEVVRELDKYGELVDIWVARNPPGFAFAEYVRSSDAEKAVRALDGMTVCGSRVRVEFAHGGRAKNARGGYRGGRSSGRGPPRRYDSPRRGGRMSPSMDMSRNQYEQLSFYSPGIANAAAGAAAGFPYGMSGYPPMLPFFQPEDFIRTIQQSRRSPRRGPPGARGRSPPFRRRSRSPLGGGFGRDRELSPPITYDGRSIGRHMDARGGRGGYNPNDFSRQKMAREYSPPISQMNGRRDDSRNRMSARDDRRRR